MYCSNHRIIQKLMKSPGTHLGSQCNLTCTGDPLTRDISEYLAKHIV